MSNAGTAAVEMALLGVKEDPGLWRERVAGAGAAALTAAAATALLGSWLLPAGAAGWLGAGVIAAAYVAAVLATAAVFGWRRLGELKRKRGARRLLGRIAVIAVWLAPVAVLIDQNSWLALPTAITFGVLAARAFAGTTPPAEQAPTFEAQWLLAPSPMAVRRRLASQSAAVLAYSAALVAGLGWIALASAMAAFACGTIAWLANRASSEQRERRRARRAAVEIALATLVTAMTLLPEGGGLARMQGQEGDTPNPPPRELRYASVVLLTDPPPLEPLLKAPPQLSSPLPGRQSAPQLSIPFSGEYWYYFWPLSRPSADALRKQGSPLTLAYSWIDRGTLIVQARQPLAEPIEANCCHAIDVVLDGAEEEPESIAIELALRRTGEESLLRLPVQSLPAMISRRGKASFALPRDESIVSFDQLVVFFHLDPDLRRRSPHLAVQRFDLIP